MLGVLSQILCWVEQIGAMVADAGVWVVNLVVAAFADAIGGVLTLLPAMPSLPDVSAQSGFGTAVEWIGEFVPLGGATGLMALIAFIFGVLTVWLVVGMVLRWAKAID